MSDAAVVHNEAAHQFEVTVDGKMAFLTYRLPPAGGSITFLHTEVPQEMEGHGIGSQLARAGLDYARDRQLSVVPLCPFVAEYVRRHPQYLEFVREDHRARLSAS